MTNPDHLIELRDRLARTRGRDRHLGCEIVARLLPDTALAAAAGAWLRQPSAAIDPDLDITGSSGAARRFLEQLGFGPPWRIRCDHSDAPEGTGSGRPHMVGLGRSFFSCVGWGWTEPQAIIDAAIAAVLAGADAYAEEDVPWPAGPGAQDRNAD